MKKITAIIILTSDKESVAVGEDITVTLTVSCKGGSFSTLVLYYDNTALTLKEYQEDGFNPRIGKLTIDAPDSDEVTRTFVFQGEKEGSTEVSISVIEFISLDGSSATDYNNLVTIPLTIYPKEELSDNSYLKNLDLFSSFLSCSLGSIGYNFI